MALRLQSNFVFWLVVALNFNHDEEKTPNSGSEDAAPINAFGPRSLCREDTNLSVCKAICDISLSFQFNNVYRRIAIMHSWDLLDKLELSKPNGITFNCHRTH
jgi:hypothetical protein